MNATETISNWIVNTSYEDIPPEAVQAARESYFDCMGVSLSGSVQPLGKILTEYVREQGGTPESTILGSGIRAPVGSAAMGGQQYVFYSRTKMRWGWNLLVPFQIGSRTVPWST